MLKTTLRAAVAGVILLAMPATGWAATTKAPAPTPAKKAVISLEDRITRAFELADAGQMDKAMAEVEAAVKMAPKSARALSARGILRGEANPDAALADFTSALALDARDPMAIYGSAMVYAQRGDTVKAIEFLSRFIEINPGDGMSHGMRGALRLAQGDKPGALEDAIMAAQDQPDYLPAVSLLSEAYLANDQYDKAVEIVHAAADRSPDNLDMQTLYAELLIDCEGSNNACRDRRAEALPVYDRIIALKPSADAYIDRAQARPLTDRDGKFADLNAALALEPNSQFGILTRGATYFNYKEYDKALEDVNAAIVLDPKDDEALSLRVRIYERNGNVEGQLGDLDVLTTLLPGKAEHFNSACWLRATRKQELDKALEQCNAALALKPGDRPITDSRAMVYLQMERWDEAIADYDTAMSENTYAIGLYGRGIARLRTGLKKEGKADLKAARKLDKTIEKTFVGYGILEKPKKDKPKMKAGKRL